jgi:hypothetical protein
MKSVARSDNCALAIFKRAKLSSSNPILSILIPSTTTTIHYPSLLPPTHSFSTTFRRPSRRVLAVVFISIHRGGTSSKYSVRANTHTTFWVLHSSQIIFSNTRKHSYFFCVGSIKLLPNYIVLLLYATVIFNAFLLFCLFFMLPNGAVMRRRCKSSFYSANFIFPLRNRDVRLRRTLSFMITFSETISSRAKVQSGCQTIGTYQEGWDVGGREKKGRVRTCSTGSTFIRHCDSFH